MKEKGKKIITLSIILFMVLNYLLPLVNYAEFDLGSIKDAIVKGLDENQEEIGREYEIKETEEWDISENGDGKVIAKWKLEDRSLTISGIGNMKNWKSSSTLYWIKYKRLIEKVIIENGVTNIGDYAFWNCYNLTSIIISNSVRIIGMNAFFGCGSLTSINIPNSVTSIRGDAFSECNRLTNIEIPNSVTSIGGYVFSGCDSLTSVNIPNSVTSIGEYTFRMCKSLTEIKVSDDNINYASINGILFNKEKTEIIRYLSNEKDIEYSIPNSVTSISGYAFEGCSNLTKVNVPNSVTSIGQNAFSGVKNIICKTNSNAHKYAEENKVLYFLSDDVVSNYSTEFQIKQTEEIDISEEGDESVIAKWNFEDKSLTISGTENMKNWEKISNENWQKKYKTFIEKVIIENGVTNIGNNIFKDCYNIKSIIISNSVTNIGDYAFYGCSSLTSVNIPNSVITIGGDAFYGCSSLTSVNLPESLISIGGGAFRKCSSLTSLKIPNSVTRIDNSIFEGCSSLTEINVSDDNINYTSIDGILYNKEKYTIIRYPSNKDHKEYNIPNSVTIIGWSAFENCSNLTSVNIPESVITIGSSAFRDCSSLTNVNIPNSVTSINEYAFSGCSRLTNITIPDRVTKIEDNTFEGCSNLTSVNIPESVTSIGRLAFRRCSSLASVNIPNSVTSIKEYTFSECSNLVEINVSDKNPKYVSTDGVLFNKEKTELIQYPSNKNDMEYNIPNRVTSIGNYAFEGCSYLTSIIIPDSVTSIESYAFFKCNSLLSIVIPQNVTIIGKKAFDDEKIVICKANSFIHKYAEEKKLQYLLDEKEPIVKIKYSTQELTNQNVTVILTTNEEVQAISGWTLSQDKKTLTKVYENNTTEIITLKDLVGNEVKQTITISNIDKTLKPVKTTGDVNENNKIDIGDILLIKRHMAYTNSTIVANKHTDWKLSDEKTKIGDINKNGKIDIGDILKLQRYISASNSKEVAQKHKDWLNLE